MFSVRCAALGSAAIACVAFVCGGGGAAAALLAADLALTVISEVHGVRRAGGRRPEALALYALMDTGGLALLVAAFPLTAVGAIFLAAHQLALARFTSTSLRAV